MNNYLTCRIGREWYGIHIENVLEVLHLVALNDIPGDTLVGVMTLREQVIPVLDLRTIFGITDHDFKLDTPIIAVRHEQQKLGLIVDEADDVMPILPEACSPYQSEGIRAIARVNERMIFLLDLPFVIEQVQANSQPVT
jgi:purine-binding chemotaxis protein CheW